MISKVQYTKIEHVITPYILIEGLGAKTLMIYFGVFLQVLKTVFFLHTASV